MKYCSTLYAALAATSLLSTSAFGQQNFQPAKVITLTGDTLRGFVDYRGWDTNPRLIGFKADLQAPLQSFRPLDIKEFRVSNEQYIGCRVAIENSPTSLEALSVSPAPIFQTDTTFLQAVVTGPRSLYRYKTDGRVYLYTENQGKFDLLIYKRFKPSANLLRSNNTFREQLATYLADCPAVAEKTRTLLYATSNVQRLFRAYYACTSQRPVLHKQKLRLQVGVLVGATHTTLRFNASPQRATPPPTFDSYTANGPTGGLFFHLPFAGSLNRFSINNDFTFNSFKTAGSSTQTTSPDNSTTTSYSLALTYLKLNTLLRFTRPIGTGALFINAGISNGYAVQTQNEQVAVSRFYSTHRTTTGEIFPVQRYEQGFVVGLGGSLNRVSAEARYERSNGFLALGSLSSSFERFTLLVGYRLH